MSHIVTIQTRLRDPAAVAAACRRLGLPAPAQGTARLYGGQASGLLVQLPGWQYPAVIDTASGEVRYDNFEGRWGEQAHLGRFLEQALGVTTAERKTEEYFHTASEQQTTRQA